jgi:glucose-1-phosphate thymidylyltransferase
LNQPKHLLEVGGRTILERLLDQLAEIESLEHVYVVTNAKFADRFRDATDSWDRSPQLSVVDDGTTSDEDRLGAIGDLDLVIRQEGLEDDLVVAAGDSVFVFTDGGIGDFVRFGSAKAAPVIGVYDVGEREAVSRYSAITTDGESRLVAFEEKPKEPETTLAGIALYFYPRAVLPLIRRYLAEGNNPDQPGRLIEWLYRRTSVYAWQVPGRWHDIGSPETLEAADRELGQ